MGGDSIHFAEYSAIFKFQFAAQCAEPIRYKLRCKLTGDTLDHSCGGYFKFQFAGLLDGCARLPHTHVIARPFRAVAISREAVYL